MNSSRIRKITLIYLVLLVLCGIGYAKYDSYGLDGDAVAFMDIEPLADLAEADAVIDWASGMAAAGDGMRLAIRDRTGRFVGTAGFNALVRERASRGEVARQGGTPRGSRRAK